MSKINLKSISLIPFKEMGKCMCVTNCGKKITDNTKVVEETAKVYSMPSLEKISNIPFKEMGKCMCVTNCGKKITDNTKAVEETVKVYRKTI